MPTFSQMQQQPRNQVPSSLAWSNLVTSGRDYREQPALQLRRAIDHQAQPWQTDAEDSRFAAAASPRLAYDFSRIPLHPPHAEAMQTKLAISAPGDEYEQEADRISEHVIRAPEPQSRNEPQLKATCACGGTCPKCRGEQPDQHHARVQTKREGTSGRGQAEAPPIVGEVLRAPGQPLDPATRAYFEPRFGHDFSRVRIHTGADAADSARSVGAMAYSVESDIVFGAGRYQPHSSAGRRLIAHELTHVVQQTGGPRVLRRAVLYPAVVPTTEDPIRRALGASNVALALTEPVINGTRIPGDLGAATTLIKRAFHPTGTQVRNVPTATPPTLTPTPGSGSGSGSGTGSAAKAAEASGSGSGSPGRAAGSGSGSGTAPRVTEGAGSGSGAGPKVTQGAGSGSGSGSGTAPRVTEGAGSGSGSPGKATPGSGSGSGAAATTAQCGFKDFDVKISALMRLPIAPSGGQWGPTHIAASDLGGSPPAICRGKTRIEVVMKGKPTTQDFYNKIKANEQEHVDDLKHASDQYLVPYYREILALRGTGPDAMACEANLEAQLGRLSEDKIRSFHARVGADIQQRDRPGGHPTRAATNISSDCSQMDIMAEPVPAPRRQGP